MNLSNNQINGLKAGIHDVMQGLLTLNKVLTMIQIPESAKYPEGRPELHDSHIQCYERCGPGSHHDSHVKRWEEYLIKCQKEQGGD